MMIPLMSGSSNSRTNIVRNRGQQMRIFCKSFGEGDSIFHFEISVTSDVVGEDIW